MSLLSLTQARDSDMLNLRALYGSDMSQAPRAKLAELRTHIAKLEQNLEKLTAALLDSDDAPKAFITKAKQIESELDDMRKAEKQLEAEYQKSTRVDITGADEVWRSLVDGIATQDYDARMRARQLVHDTFEKIVVWWKGVDPEEAPPGCIDVLLVAKGGRSRMLRIDSQGKWIAHDDIQEAA